MYCFNDVVPIQSPLSFGKLLTDDMRLRDFGIEINIRESRRDSHQRYMVTCKDIFAFRVTGEPYLADFWDKDILEYAKRGNYFYIRTSRWIDELSVNTMFSSLMNQSKTEPRHYVLTALDFIFEFISASEPTVTAQE